MIVALIPGGDKWNTIALADEFIAHVNENPALIPSDKTLELLRNLNPDGDARGHGIDGRVYDHGVDIHRNFQTNGTAGRDRNSCWASTPTTGGELWESKLPDTPSRPWIPVVNQPLGHKLRFLPFRKAQFMTECGIFTGTLTETAVELGAVSVELELSTHKYADFKENQKALEVVLHRKR